jgi:hypothetical protein
MSTPRKPLPDLEDDEAFVARMRPLADRILPSDRKPRECDATVVSIIPSTETPDNRNTAVAGIQPSGYRDGGSAGSSAGLIDAARRQQEIEAKRGAKRKFDYLIPERVGRALAEDAARRGMSATMRLLEVLRDAGYPVIPEDLVDMRKLPKR